MHVHRQRGQSSAELVAVVALLAAIAAIAIQIIQAAGLVMEGAGASRVGTRAALVGLPGEAAARRALPGSVSRRATVVERRADGRSLVSVVVPIEIGLPGSSAAAVVINAGTGR